jgi:hypothetical protein
LDEFAFIVKQRLQALLTADCTLQQQFSAVTFFCGMKAKLVGIPRAIDGKNESVKIIVI